MAHFSSKAWLESIWRPLPSHVPRESRLKGVRLDKNECLDTELIKVLHTKIAERIRPDHLSLYPETGPLYLKLAHYLEFPLENIFLSAGSDGSIRAVFEVFVRKSDRVLITNPTFAMYPVYCKVFNAQSVAINYTDDLKLPIKSLHDEIEKGVALVALPNPDSPTGSVLPPHELKEIIMRAGKRGAIVLVDEAYHPYYPKSVIEWVHEFDNLIVTRTFSKAWGLAGFRVGFAVAPAALTRLLHAQKPMYEVNTFAVEASCVALEHSDQVLESVTRTMAGKKYFCQVLTGLGFKVIEGNANFIHVNFGAKREKIIARLKKKGVFFRESFVHPSLKGFSRFTAAPEPVMKQVVNIIRNCIS